VEQWALCSLAHSPGARRYYDQLRARGKTRRQVLRQLANRWVGILHIRLQREQLYDESAAWHDLVATAASPGTCCGCAARVRKKPSICPIASLNWSASIGLTM
jgi:hypothetical protein